MVLDKVERINAPTSLLQKAALFPYDKVIKGHLFFKVFAGIGSVAAAGWAYIFLTGSFWKLF
jgi:hypothetical protein